MHLSFPSAPFYALRTYLIQQKDDIYALHMMSLLLERDGQLEAAVDTLYRLCEILEHQYEESEDPNILEKFCVVKSDIARVTLALGEFESAVETGATALDLSQSIDGIGRARLSSQIVVGLGYYFLGKLDEAIEVFQRVLTESDEDVDVMALVAKVLWSVGGDQEREIAVQQLHDWYVGLEYFVANHISLARYPLHVDSLTSLGAIGRLAENEDFMDQAEMGLRRANLMSPHDNKVPKVLREFARSKGHDFDDVYRAQVMLNPASASAWSGLDNGHDVTVQRLALKLARLDKTTITEELSEFYESSGSLVDIQSGILLCPWRIEGWKQLSWFS